MSPSVSELFTYVNEWAEVIDQGCNDDDISKELVWLAMRQVCDHRLELLADRD